MMPDSTQHQTHGRPHPPPRIHEQKTLIDDRGRAILCRIPLPGLADEEEHAETRGRGDAEMAGDHAETPGGFGSDSFPASPRPPIPASSSPDPRLSFHAQGVLNFALPGGQTGAAQFAFEIPGRTPAEAFANFDAAFASAKLAAEHDVHRQLAAQARQLVMPDGRPLPPVGKPKTRAA